MAMRVPVRERAVTRQQLPSVELGVRAGAGDFGELEASVIEQIGRQVSQVDQQLQLREERVARAEQEKLKALEKRRKEGKDFRDKMYSMDAVVRFQDFYRKQKVNYFSKKGLEADGIGDKATKDIDSAIQLLIDGAENDEQRLKIRTQLGGIRESSLNEVYSYESGELKKASAERTDAFIFNTLQSARDSHNNPISLFGFKLDLENAVDLKTQGMDKEVKNKVKAEHFSIFHEGVINEKAVFNADLAKTYYEENKDEILPDKRPAIEKVLKTEDTLQFAQAKADEIALIEPDRTQWNKIARETKYPGTPEEAAEKRKATESELKTLKNTLDQEEVEQKQRVLIDALKKIDAAPDKRSGDAIANRLEDPINSEKARKYSDAKFKLKKEDIVTDRVVQARVYENIDLGVIDSVDDLLEYAPHLSSADYDKAITAIRSKKEPDAKIGSMKYSIMKNAFSNVIGETYDVEDEDQNKQFMDIQGKLDELSREKGDSLTFTEAVTEIRKLLVNGEVPGALWGRLWSTDLTRPEAEARGELHRWLPKILTEEEDNNEELRFIEDSLKSRGIVTENKTLMRLFKKDAILKIPLSEEEAAEYRRLLLGEKGKSGRELLKRRGR